MAKGILLKGALYLQGSEHFGLLGSESSGEEGNEMVRTTLTLPKRKGCMLLGREKRKQVVHSSQILTLGWSMQIPEDADISTLVGYGALFGVLHVLTGPDHISYVSFPELSFVSLTNLCDKARSMCAM
jgi:hypothetical protein